LETSWPILAPLIYSIDRQSEFMLTKTAFDPRGMLGGEKVANVLALGGESKW